MLLMFVRVSPFSLVFIISNFTSNVTAFDFLLSLLSKLPDVCFGVIINNEIHDKIRSALGLQVNTGKSR